MANLITLAKYKTAEGLQSTKDDAKLELLIESVSQLVKTYCNTTFVDYYTNAKTELFNINYNESFIQLAEGPVVMGNDAPTVSERTDFTGSYTTLTQDADYYIDTDLDCIYRIGTAWPKGPGAVKVVYKAGYATIPADLQLAVIDLITYYRKDHHRTARQTIAGATVENRSSSSTQNNPAFPDHIKRVLDLYKNF